MNRNCGHIQFLGSLLDET